MKVILQRSKQAHVEVNKKVVGKIEHGLVVLVGFTHNDTEKEIDYLVDKIINLRIFNDEKGVMNKSLIEVDGSILSVSQFTLYADSKKGRRPSYINALNGDKAILLYNMFNEKLKSQNINVETGLFGADMQVVLTNDGPVTIILEKENENGERQN